MVGVLLVADKETLAENGEVTHTAITDDDVSVAELIVDACVALGGGGLGVNIASGGPSRAALCVAWASPIDEEGSMGGSSGATAALECEFG